MPDPKLMKLQNGSDIRGIALEGVPGEDVNLTDDICNKIGQAFVLWLSQKTGKKAGDLKIGVGRDSRISGPKLEDSVIEGINFKSALPVRCGLATTPAMFMSLIFDRTRFDGSVMITASHLPFNRNGLKFFDADGGLDRGDITEILSLASSCEPGRPGVLKCKSFDLLSLYSEHLKNAIKSAINCKNEKPLSGLKIAIDAGNGAGGFFAEKILKPLGADTTGSQFLEPDGNFPNHIPNPENPEAMDAIRSAVIKNRADLGLIFDTDVDRMSAVLSDGTEVNRDAIIAITAAILAPEYPGSTIVTDSVTSDRLTYFLEDVLKLKHLRYMRGYKNVINKCKELNKKGIVSPLAMETSGHGALKENYYLDDGAFLAVKLVIALANAKQNGKELSSLIEKLPSPVEAKEYRFKILTEDFKTYGNRVLDQFKKNAAEAGYKLPESFEGIRISFNDDKIQGWALLRLSLHDPVMPLNIEGARKGDLNRIKEVVKDLTAGFDKLDLSGLEN
ncbi:phosphomannomutase/phosphoglucomutase [Treponema parvum]|uniref:phosphomannomutase/phosphoglucomutase n=1 Tax=Treponema parvum TaxID=138851 RepID=UPI001AEC6886|nr:phosphomannomutase/phosphoglucomutase [Treponema parvum]QTQ17254.1 phosphomannomutase/phosphoglucomutase [Treponema parvum]